MKAIIEGRTVPSSHLGELIETSVESSNTVLRKNFDRDGYLLLRNVIKKNKIQKARNEIFKNLHEINEIKKR